MAILLPLLLLALMVLIVALLYPTGLWGNALNLVNAVIAALLATNFWEPVSSTIKGVMPSLVFVVDIFVLWLLFAGIFFGLRFATDAVSKVKVRFPKPVELGGNIFFAVWTAWVVVCFATMTLHTAPCREFLAADFRPSSRCFSAFIPIVSGWALRKKMSLGTFSRSRRSCIRSAGRIHAQVRRAPQPVRTSKRRLRPSPRRTPRR